jgi:predicted site-specific integrase-resolvase
MAYGIDALVTAQEAAPALGVKTSLIAKWRSDCKIKPCGKRGRALLYKLSDLQRVEAETRNSPYNLRRT